MKKTLTTFLTLLVAISMICTLFSVSAIAASSALTLDGNTDIDMASFVPTKLYQQTSGVNAADFAPKNAPTFADGKLTTAANYQYLEFEADVTKAGLYTMYVEAQAMDASERLFMYVDGELCSYFGDKMYQSSAYYGVTLSNTGAPEIYLGSANLSIGKHTIRITSQTSGEITFAGIRFEFNTYLTNNAQNAATNAAGKSFDVYQTENAGGYALGQLKVSKLKENDYLEVSFNAPKTGKYDVSFMGIADSKWRNVVSAVSIDNNVVNDALTVKGGDNQYVLTEFDVADGVELTAGTHTLKFVVASCTNESAFLPVNTVKLTYIPKEFPETVGEIKLFDKAKAQTFYPREISGITFVGETLGTGYAANNEGVHSGTAVSLSPVENTYVDADGNYTFLANQFSDGTGGTVTIPVNVNTAGNYDVTVNYHITDNEALTYAYLFYWSVKANDTFLSNTELFGNGTQSLTDKLTLNAGSADFTKGKNNISFTLNDEGKYARPIVIESITLTPNTDMNFILNPAKADITSDNVVRTVESTKVNATTYYVMSKYAPSTQVSSETAVVFTFDAPCDGYYDIGFTYAGLEGGGTKTGAKWNVSLNDVVASEVNFVRNYRSEASSKVNAYLNEGTNTMKLTYSGTDAATGDAVKDYGFFLTDNITFTLTSEAPELSDILITEMPSAGEYYAVATILNDTDEIEKVSVIAAVYDEVDDAEYLKNAKVVTDTISVGETKDIIIPVSVGSDVQNGNIKFFVWKDMIPLDDVSEIR